MIKLTVVAASLAIVLSQGHCADTAGALSFEVASITPCKPGSAPPHGQDEGMAQFVQPGGRFIAKTTTVQFLLEWSYGIQPSQHSAGPDWLANDRYDIIAKAPGNATEAEMKAMVRTLLAERFHLQMHRETKTLSALVVTTGKTAPKLNPPQPGEPRAMRMSGDAKPEDKTVIFHITATRFPLEQTLDIFSRQLGAILVNRTGLDGDFDFSVDLTQNENQRSLDPAQILNALRDQLGLVVKPEKVPLDYLAIDSVEKVVHEM
jgi:uncharacterized protein (TIGR03435 family)